jgi:tetratricopeptide (TPR) repeat protein
VRDRKTFHLAMSIALLLSLILPFTAHAVGGGPAPAPVAPRSAEAEYNKGLQAKAAKRYPDAVNDFRRAVDIRPNYPEAWNELGFALRNTGRYAEALRAYEQALRLRPDYPEALEYMGEAYVKLGRLDEARAILERLKPLDVARAQDLEDAIRAGR